MRDITVLIRECNYYRGCGTTVIDARLDGRKWRFEAWDRDVEDCKGWYDERYENKKIRRFYDRFRRVRDLENWANSRDITDPQEVGAILWANFYVIAEKLKSCMDSGGLYTVERYVQLYKQLEIIHRLDLKEVRREYNCPHIDGWMYDFEAIKDRAEELCAELVEDEAGRGFKHLDFMEIIGRAFEEDIEYVVLTCRGMFHSIEKVQIKR